jgi:outer membrane receptor protein involved in Fe transport
MIRILLFIFVFCICNFAVFAQKADSIGLFTSSVQEILSKEVREEISLLSLFNVDITTASRKAEKLGKAPATIIVVTEEQIRTRHYQSLIDVLQDIPEFKIEKKSDPESVNVPIVRGIRGSQSFAILLDGVKISSPTAESVPILENYPVHIAKQIEIVFGPASALYGADAVAGVINIISKEAEKKGFHAHLTSNYGTYNTTNHTLLVSSRLAERTTLSISGQYFYDQSPNMSELYPNNPYFSLESHKTGTFNSRFGKITPKAKVNPVFEMPYMAYNFNANLNIKDFSLTFFRNYAQNPSALGYTTNNAVYNKDVFFGQSITMGAISGKHRLGKTFLLSSQMTGSTYELSPESNYRNVFVGMEQGYKYGYGSMLKWQEQLDFDLGQKLHIVVGGTYERFFSMPKGFDMIAPVDTKQDIKGFLTGSASSFQPEGIPIPIAKVGYLNLGGYAQAQYSPSSKVTITAGLRYDHNSRFGGSLNPRLGVVYSPADKTTIKAMYGRAFFAPSPYTSFQQFGSFTAIDSIKRYRAGFLQLPNPNLQPFTSNAYEIGIKQFIGNNFSLNLYTHYTQLNNLFALGSDKDNTNIYNGQFLGYPVDYIQVTFNEGQQNNYGGTLQIDYFYKFQKGNIGFYAAASYLDGTTETNTSKGFKTVEIASISTLMGKVGVEGRYGKFYGSIRASIFNAQRLGLFEDNNNPYTRKTMAGYTLVNTSFGCDISKTFNTFFLISNMLNEQYLTGEGMLQSPIRFTGGVSVKW